MSCRPQVHAVEALPGGESTWPPALSGWVSGLFPRDCFGQSDWPDQDLKTWTLGTCLKNEDEPHPIWMSTKNSVESNAGHLR